MYTNMSTVFLKRIIIFLLITTPSFCKAEVKIDSCSIDLFYPTWIKRCYVSIKSDTAYVYSKCDACETITLSTDTTKMILDGITDIFVKKKYPIIVSKTKANDILYSEYPFLHINIFYGRKKIEKILLVAPRNEYELFHYSEAFVKLWDLIDKVVKDYQYKFNGYRLRYFPLPL